MTTKNDNKRERDSATLLALLGLMAVAAMLLGISALVIPSLVMIPVLLFAFFAFCLFHYVVWGRWLSRSRETDGNDPDDSE